MAKTQISRQKTEIVRQVKLTPKQRLMLLSMANNGGKSRAVDYNVRHDLIALGLIEEGELHPTREAKAGIAREIAALWLRVRKTVAAKRADDLYPIIRDIREKEDEVKAKAYWLTKAASEYLTKGKVTVTL